MRLSNMVMLLAAASMVLALGLLFITQRHLAKTKQLAMATWAAQDKNRNVVDWGKAMFTLACAIPITVYLATSWLNELCR
jgi:hypothetical protein